MESTRRVTLTLLAVIPAVLIIVGLVAFIYNARVRMLMGTDFGLGSRLSRELSQARAKGLPTAMADLRKPMPPASKNAAPLYVAMAQELRKRPLTSDQKVLERIIGIHSVPSGSDWAAAKIAMQQRSDLYGLVHQAVARPQCAFTRDWTTPDPINIQFPEFATVREAERLLTAQSLMMAHDGNYTGAIQNQIHGFTIARHGASDPTEISYLVGLACDAVTLGGLRRIVSMSQGSPTVAAAVTVAIRQNWKPRSLSQAMKGELAFEQGELDYLESTGPEGMAQVDRDAANLANSPEMQRNWPLIVQINRELLLREMSQVVAVADQPYSEAFPKLQQVDAEVVNRTQNSHFLAVMLWPVPAEFAEKRAQIQATEAVDLAGCAVFVARSRTGQFPARLPGKFSDPFSDGALQYRREGSGGFVVYSVGPDGIFDGGEPGVKQKGTETYFRYPLVSEE